ncbi:MAG: prenyltransferase [Heliobacteriaceae bacterium]|nr:prenyltransferase [Heliobacteriaceae bacterium]
MAVGAGAAFRQAGTLNFGYLLLALLGALAAHVAVNVLNDYFDYTSGLDRRTIPTPFSGGSGLLPAKQMSPSTALAFGLAALGVTIAIGVFFLFIQGWELLLVAVPGILLVAFYTQNITRLPLLCLLAPGLGFGPCMVLGTYFVLQGSYDPTALAASLIPGFLVSNLLLLNQFPDVEADRTAGRRHLPILLGTERSALLYAWLALGAFCWIGLSVYLGLLPSFTLIALLPLPLALHTIRGVRKNHRDIPALVPFMVRNVVFTLTTPLLVAVGLFVA